MRETWYLLEDGTAADPNDVAPDAAGKLVHSGGVPVAIGPQGPKSRSMSEDEMQPYREKVAADLAAKEAAESEAAEAAAKEAAEAAAKEATAKALEAETQPKGYKTRASKAD